MQDKFIDTLTIDQNKINVEIVKDAILFHFSFFPKWKLGNEIALMQIGAWMDVTHRKRLGIYKKTKIIHQQFPRKGLDFKFPIHLVCSCCSLRATKRLLFPKSTRKSNNAS